MTHSVPLTNLRTFVFSLYERRLLRNWFYTVAFSILVPLGLRFAIYAWSFGGRVDRLLTVIGGITVGATVAVTMLRIWAVPPSRTLPESPTYENVTPRNAAIPGAADILAACNECTARNRRLARDARALGAPRILTHC